MPPTLFSSAAWPAVRCKDFDPVITANSAIFTLGRKQYWAAALHTALALRSQILEPDAVTQTAALSTAGSGQLWRTTMVLLREAFQGIQIDVITCSAAMNICKTTSRWRLAAALMGWMWAAAVKPNVVSYSTATSAAEKGSHWEGACHLLDDMRFHHGEPNAFTYSAIAGACER